MLHMMLQNTVLYRSKRNTFVVNPPFGGTTDGSGRSLSVVLQM